MKTIITHNGSYHNDELFAVALFAYYLELKNEKYEIIRTRDEEKIAHADIVIDVGGEYDPAHLRFDHHQLSFTKLHEKSAIKMASMGIVFDYIIGKIKEEQLFGEDTKHITDDALFKISLNVVRPIDAHDNGIDLSSLKDIYSEYPLDRFIDRFQYEKEYDEDFTSADEAFLYVHNMLKIFIKRTIQGLLKKEKDYIISKEIVNKINGDVVIFEHSISMRRIIEETGRIRYIIIPRDDGKWNTITAYIKDEEFNRRTYFPASWRGLRDKELEKETGVRGAIFCHKGGQLCVAETKEQAIELVNLSKKIKGE